MARVVSEVMNHELVSVREGTDLSAIRDLILAMGITAVPVVDREQRPIGVLSLRDLINDDAIRARMSRPAMTVHEAASLEEAGRLLAATDFHHMVVVDARGHAVGMLSAIDLLRGLLGVPARHPAAFPHIDPEFDVSWTDDEFLAPDRLANAPQGAGIIVLVRGGHGLREVAVWAEASERVQARLEELLSIPQSDAPALALLLTHGGLRYRAAAVADPATRARIVEVIRERIGHQPLPTEAADR